MKQLPAVKSQLVFNKGGIFEKHFYKWAENGSNLTLLDLVRVCNLLRVLQGFLWLSCSKSLKRLSPLTRLMSPGSVLYDEGAAVCRQSGCSNPSGAQGCGGTSGGVPESFFLFSFLHSHPDNCCCCWVIHYLTHTGAFPHTCIVKSRFEPIFWDSICSPAVKNISSFSQQTLCAL